MTSMQTDLGRGEVPREETASLIASDKVEGTAVYGPDGDKIGRIENLMIDKWSGRGRLCGAQLRRLPRHGDRSLPLAVVDAEIRRKTRWLSCEHHPGAAPERAPLPRRRPLGLGEPGIHKARSTDITGLSRLSETTTQIAARVSDRGPAPQVFGAPRAGPVGGSPLLTFLLNDRPWPLKRATL